VKCSRRAENKNAGKLAAGGRGGQSDRWPEEPVHGAKFGDVPDQSSLRSPRSEFMQSRAQSSGSVRARAAAGEGVRWTMQLSRRSLTSMRRRSSSSTGAVSKRCKPWRTSAVLRRCCTSGTRVRSSTSMSVAQSGDFALAERQSVEWIDGDGTQQCASDELG